MTVICVKVVILTARITTMMMKKETMKMNKDLELRALKGRYNLIMSRGKTMEGEGVLRKILRKIRKLEKELNA